MKQLYIAIVTIIVTLTTAGPARAGNQDAGGGDVVLRKDREGKPVLLDYYVGLKLGYLNGPEDLRRGLGDPATESEHVKVRRVLARVAHFDLVLALRATEVLAKYHEIVDRVAGPILLVDDENLETSLEPDEQLFQAAAWKATASSVKLWQVNELIYQRMDYNQRAGLILHEIFYVLHNGRRINGKRHQNARYLRQFVAVISGWSFTGADAEEWDMMMAAFNLF